MSPGKALRPDQLARMRVLQDRMDRVNLWMYVCGVWLIPAAWAGATFGPVAGWAVFVVGLLGIVAGIVVVRRRRRPPTPVESWADEHGWSYTPASSIVPFSGRDVLRKVVDGLTVTSYTTTAAPDLTAETPIAPRHAVWAIVPADLPRLLVLPEALTRRPGAAPLEPDVQFESAAFNARWRVHCGDAVFAHAFCHPLVMERLMNPDARGVSLLVEGRDVVVHAPGPTEPAAVESRAKLAADLVRLVPPYLLARYPGRARRKRRGPGRWYQLRAALSLLMLAGAGMLLVPMVREGGRLLELAVMYGALLVGLAAIVVASARADRRRAAARRRALQG